MVWSHKVMRFVPCDSDQPWAKFPSLWCLFSVCKWWSDSTSRILNSSRHLIIYSWCWWMAPSPSLKIKLSKSNPKLSQTTERETSGIETNRPSSLRERDKKNACYNMCCFFFLHNNHLCAYVCMYVYMCICIVCVCVWLCMWTAMQLGNVQTWLGTQLCLTIPWS